MGWFWGGEGEGEGGKNGKKKEEKKDGNKVRFFKITDI